MADERDTKQGGGHQGSRTGGVRAAARSGGTSKAVAGKTAPGRVSGKVTKKKGPGTTTGKKARKKGGGRRPEAPFPVVEPGSAGMSAERLARIRPWMERYVESGRLPGAMTAVARDGEVVWFDYTGMASLEEARPLAPDTIFRIYSMTKPITSVALMMLYEEGLFQLEDPVSRFIPAFAGLRVFAGGDADAYETEPAEREMTIRDLLTHTSGLTYDFIGAHPVDELYRRHGIRHVNSDEDLAAMVERLAGLPLVSHPGREWNYSVSTDVVGYLVELISGVRFDRFLHERVLEPLGMVDTAFWVPPEKLERFAACYTPGPEGLALVDDPRNNRFTRPRTFFSGGGGLVSTVRDYMRFCTMLLGEGELDGVRLLGRKTVEWMTMNHLPGDMASMGQPTFSESSYEGIGFGLGFSVVIDPARSAVMQSEGTFAWGGAASTAFWVDPEEGVTTVFLTQLHPSSTYPLRSELRVLVNQAIVD